MWGEAWKVGLLLWKKDIGGPERGNSLRGGSGRGSLDERGETLFAAGVLGDRTEDTRGDVLACKGEGAGKSRVEVDSARKEVKGGGGHTSS